MVPPSDRGFKRIALIYNVTSKLSAGTWNLHMVLLHIGANAAFVNRDIHLWEDVSTRGLERVTCNQCFCSHGRPHAAEFGSRDLPWTASEHQCSCNKTEINVGLITGETGSAASCNSTEGKKKKKNRHISSWDFSKSTKGHRTSLWPQTKGLDHLSQQGWNMDQWSWGLQRLAALTQVYRLSSSIFAALFSCDNDFTPVSSPFTLTECWNNIPKKGLFCFIFCPDANHLAINYNSVFIIRGLKDCIAEIAACIGVCNIDLYYIYVFMLKSVFGWQNSKTI